MSKEKLIKKIKKIKSLNQEAFVDALEVLNLSEDDNLSLEDLTNIIQFTEEIANKEKKEVNLDRGIRKLKEFMNKFGDFLDD